MPDLDPFSLSLRRLSSSELVEKRDALEALVDDGALNERSVTRQLQEISRIETELHQRRQRTGLSEVQER